MAWTAPMTFVDGTALTAAQLNIYLRDNMNETEAAKATTAGGLFIAAGPNEILERVGGSQHIDESETTTSTSFTNLATVGPQVTCTTGTRAFYFITAEISNNTANMHSLMAIEISGKTSQSPTDAGSLQIDGITADKSNRIGICGFYEELVPGENVFTAKYRTGGGTATFGDRSLTVIPF